MIRKTFNRRLYLCFLMRPDIKPPQTVDEYIAAFPVATQKLLQEIRAVIMKAAPKSEEVIAYQIPAYTLNGPLVYFAGYKGHIGFYPTPSAIVNFKNELLAYKSSKGAIQFPLNEKLPVTLITKMVKFRIAENLAKQAAKSKK